MTRSLILVWADPETGEVMNADGTVAGKLLKYHESHDWSKDGERCANCGDKDWMAGSYCVSLVDLSGAAVKLPEESNVGYRDIDGDWVSPWANGHNACLNAILATMPKEE